MTECDPTKQFRTLNLTFPAPTECAMRYSWGGHDFENIVVAGLNAINAGILVQSGVGDAIPSTVEVTAAPGGTLLVAASLASRRCSIWNNGALPVTISDGGTPVAGTAGSFVLNPGGYWERPVAARSAIKGITGSGSANCFVTVY